MINPQTANYPGYGKPKIQPSRRSKILTRGYFKNEATCKFPKRGGSNQRIYLINRPAAIEVGHSASTVVVQCLIDLSIIKVVEIFAGWPPCASLTIEERRVNFDNGGLGAIDLIEWPYGYRFPMGFCHLVQHAHPRKTASAYLGTCHVVDGDRIPFELFDLSSIFSIVAFASVPCLIVKDIRPKRAVRCCPHRSRI
jgi:hypothetical protein